MSSLSDTTSAIGQKTARPSPPCSNDSALARPDNGGHEEILVATYARILTANELELMAQRKLAMCDDQGKRYVCIAVGSALLTARELYKLCARKGIDVAKELAL